MRQETKNALLLGSVLLNVVIIGVFIWFVGYSRQTMLEFVADAAETQIQLQERVMEDIASEDPVRISALTNSMRWSVDAQRRVRNRLETKQY